MEDNKQEDKVRTDNISKDVVLVATIILALKLKLEKSFAKIIKRIFNNFVSSISSTYSKYGFLPMYDELQTNIENAIAKNYVKVGNAFDDFSRIELGIKKDDEGFNKRLSDIIRIRGYNRANQSTNKIIVTAEKETNKALKLILLAAALSGIVLTNKAIAKQLKNILTLVLGNKVMTIAATETAYAAEQTKVDELDVLYETNAVLPIGERMESMTSNKTWVARFINTRQWHADAHGQRKRLNEPYIVADELLMYPLDDRLGATAKNIINCHCSSIIETKRILR